MITPRGRYKLQQPVRLHPGDRLICRVNRKDGYEEYSENIGHALSVDTIATFDVQNELGFKNGVMGCFGLDDGTIEPHSFQGNVKQ